MPVSLDSGLAAILPKGATGMKASGKTMSFAPRCADSATAARSRSRGIVEQKACLGQRSAPRGLAIARLAQYAPPRSRYRAGEAPRSLLGGLIAYRLRRHGFRSGRGGRAQLPLPLFFLLLFLEEISLALGKRIIGLRQLAILRLAGWKRNIE